MKLAYWGLATLLVAVMAAYITSRESSGVCQVPHSTTYRVLR
jgi:hypothetical protein